MSAKQAGILYSRRMSVLKKVLCNFRRPQHSTVDQSETRDPLDSQPNRRVPLSPEQRDSYCEGTRGEVGGGDDESVSNSWV